MEGSNYEKLNTTRREKREKVVIWGSYARGSSKGDKKPRGLE